MPMMYIDENNATNIFQQLWQQCKGEEYCDIVLTAGSLRIPAHRNILSATSEYFRGMFSSLKLEIILGEIKLPSFQQGVLQSLVEFIYTGRIEIRTDNVMELLKTANMLDLKRVMIGCEKFLMTGLNASNCFRLLLLAEQYKFTKLLQRAKTYCCMDFMEAKETEEFKSLKIEQLIEIVTSDELCTSNEEDVFNSLMKWIQHDRKKRKKYTEQLLKLVRLPLLEKSFLFHKVKPLCISKDCLELYAEALEWHILQDRKVLSKKSPTFMVAITLNEKPNSLYIHYYCPQRLEWIKCSIALKYRNAFGIAVNANKLYILGGRDGSNVKLGTVLCLNLETMDLSSIAPMIEERDGFRAAFLNGFLYAICGKDSSSVEKWNPKTNKWSKVASMSEARINFGVAVLNEKLYVIGGVFDRCTITSSAECYDPQLNIWKSIKSMNESRLLPGVAVANGLLYAVGGSKGEKTVERYDPQIDNWTMVCPLRETLYGNQSCTSYHNKVVVCYQNRIEEYNPETNEWIETVLLNEVDSIYRLFSYSDKLLRSESTSNVLQKRNPTYLVAITLNEKLNSLYIHYYCPQRLEWMNCSIALEQRKAFGIAVNENKLYILGGRDGSDVKLDTVLCLNLETMDLRLKAPMMKARDGFRAAFLNGFLYAAGGANSGSVEKWDPETNAWSTVASMSTKRWNFGIAVLNEKLYVVGGVFDGMYFDGSNIMKSVECYDPQLNIWKSIKPMNEARHLPGVAASNGLLYAVGGVGINTVERYDPHTNNWTMVCPLREPLYGIQSCTSYRNKVVVCYRNRIEEYDSGTNKWVEIMLSNEVNSIYRLFSYSDKLFRSETAATFIMAITLNDDLSVMNIHYYCPQRLKWLSWCRALRYRRGFGIAVNENELYILGGRDELNNELDRNVCLNLETMDLKTIAPMSKERDGYRAAYLNGFLYAIWGSWNSVEKWDPETNRWSTVASMTRARINSGIAVLNKKIYVVGGFYGGEMNSAEYYDPQLNIWKSIKPMNEARNLPGVAVSNGLLYAVGGEGTNTVERYDPQTDKWTMVCPLREPLYGIQSCTSYRNKVVVCYQNRIEEYNPETNKWVEILLLNEVDSIYRLFSYSNKLSTSSFTTSDKLNPFFTKIADNIFQGGCCCDM